MRRVSVAALFIILFGFPVVFLLLGSFSAGSGTIGMRDGASIRAWSYLAAQFSPLVIAIVGSLAYSLCTVVLSLAVCIAPARLLARRMFPGSAMIEATLLAPALLPAITFSMGLHQVFIRLGLVDTFAGVVLVLSFVSYPYMLRSLISGYAGFSERYEQCAVNLGAGSLRVFFKVELPFLLPSITAGGAVVFLVAFSDYFLVFLLGGGAVPSLTGYLVPFITSSDFTVASALVLVFLLVPVVLFFLQEQILVLLLRKRGMEV